MVETITVRQLEKLIGWTPKTQANMRSAGALPYSKIGRKVVYLAEDIEKMVREHRIPAKTEAGA